eukprot:138494_1
MEQNEYIQKNNESKSIYQEPYETKEFQRSEPYETKEIESNPVTMTVTVTNTNKIPAENTTKKIIKSQNNVQISVENSNEKTTETRNSNSSASSNSNNNWQNKRSNKHLTTMARSDDIENSHEDSGGHGPHGFGSIEDEEQAMLATPSDRHITQETKNRLNSDSIGIDEMVNKYELEQKNKTRIKGKKKYASISEEDTSNGDHDMSKSSGNGKMIIYNADRDVISNENKQSSCCCTIL